MKCESLGTMRQSDPIERPRYFPRQLMTPAEMMLEQRFFIDKLRRHNRLLHGWGIVCGLRIRLVENTDDDLVVEVEPGYALDGFGNEVVVGESVLYPLLPKSSSGDQTAASEFADPWCADVPLDRRDSGLFIIAVRYEDCETRPVRVQPAGCGCDDIGCEYSRIRETFVIKALPEVPASHKDLEQPPSNSPIQCTEHKACPPCPPDPWIVLAALEKQADGTWDVNCDDYRRYVVSFAEYFYLCQELDARQSVEELKERMQIYIDKSKLEVVEVEYGGDLARLLAFDASSLRGVGPKIGKMLEGITVEKIARVPNGQEREFFVEIVGEDPLPRGLNPRELVVRAREVERLVEDYRRIRMRRW